MGPEPTLHAIAIDPCEARCGDEVRVAFRTRNYGTAPSPAARVTFALGAGLEPLDATEVAIESVAPGDEVRAVLRARVAAALPDRTEVSVAATLAAGDNRYRTNVATLLVRSTAILDGPASGTFVNALDDDIVRLRAVVENEGDGPAEHVRIRLAPPLGCEVVDRSTPAAVHELRRLEPGERCDLSLDARIVAPMQQVVADGADVAYDGGGAALPVRSTVQLRPDVALADASVHAARRSARIAIVVENRGWADATDVALRIAVPNAFRLIGETATLDGIPLATAISRRRDTCTLGRIARERGGARIEVGSVAARSTACLELPAVFPAGTADGSIAISLGEQRLDVPFVPERARDVRAFAALGPRAVMPGEHVVLPLRVLNAGDEDERLSARVDGDAPGERATYQLVRAGTIGEVAVAVRVPADAQREAALDPVVIIAGERGERARTTLRLFVRGVAEPRADLAVPHDVAPRVSGRLCGPERMIAGVPCSMQLELQAGTAARNLRLLVPHTPALSYVAGSAELDGHVLLDRCDAVEGGSPFAGDGLVLRDVPAGTRIVARWSLVAAPPAEHDTAAVAALVEVDDAAPERYSVPIAIVPREPFAVQPALPYHVEGYAVATTGAAASAPLPEAPPEPEPERESDPAPFAPTLHFGPRRLHDLERLGGAFRGRGLVAHLFALPLFFPDDETCAGAPAQTDLASLERALRDVYDRLYVKLRIPNFVVSSEDLEDADSRRALLALLGRSHGDALERAPLEPSHIARAPYGAPGVLRTLVALLPVQSDEARLSTAFSHFALRLDGVLARYDGAPLELFDDALVTLDDRALNDAREALLLALPSYVAPLETVC